MLLLELINVVFVPVKKSFLLNLLLVEEKRYYELYTISKICLFPNSGNKIKRGVEIRHATSKKRSVLH